MFSGKESKFIKKDFYLVDGLRPWMTISRSEVEVTICIKLMERTKPMVPPQRRPCGTSKRDCRIPPLPLYTTARTTTSVLWDLRILLWNVQRLMGKIFISPSIKEGGCIIMLTEIRCILILVCLSVSPSSPSMTLGGYYYADWDWVYIDFGLSVHQSILTFNDLGRGVICWLRLGVYCFWSVCLSVHPHPLWSRSLLLNYMRYRK